jgi:crossover junction endodeoxyribonuclease RusA
MVEVSRAVGPWREAVRAETQATWERGDADFLPDAAVEVRIAFYLPRPKSAPRSRFYPTVRPDLDKLSRAVLDGITAGGALHDDSQVVMLVAAKHYADEYDAPGCEINIEEA